MRCDMCPLSPTAEDDCCPIAYSEYGIEHKDGMAGCKHPWNWVKKRDEEYADYLGKMGEGMAKMMEEEHKIDEEIKKFLYWLFEKKYVCTDTWEMWHLDAGDILEEYRNKRRSE